MALLHRHYVQVHEVTVHLPVSRRRVPAAHSQDLQALHRLAEVWKKQVILLCNPAKRHKWIDSWYNPQKCLKSCRSFYLPVLVLRLERHQGAIFASRQDVLWGCTVNLLQLVASFLTPTAVCRSAQREKHVSVSHFKHWWGKTSGVGAVPPRSPSVKMLRKDRELQSTPL